MSTLQNTVTKEIICLNTQHTFGRNKHSSNTFISELDISQLHAVISWKGNAWYIYDQSRNGTLVNGKFINNSSLQISIGTKIQFGEKRTTEWEVLDCNSPTSYLKSIQKPYTIIELRSSHAFPNEETPNTFIYPSNEIWKLEKNGKTEDLITNTTYSINGEDYLFIENKAIEDTMDMGFSTSEAFFQFILSSDEEHIKLQLITKNQKIDLGERVHNYILLALVRKKLEDHIAEYVIDDQGWLDVNLLLEDLSKELNKDIDIYYLNLKIHRIRKLLLDIKSYGHLFSKIIERRPGEIRFSHPYFQIIKEEKCIGEILPIKNNL